MCPTREIDFCQLVSREGTPNSGTGVGFAAKYSTNPPPQQ
jgi:hypothetical protein